MNNINSLPFDVWADTVAEHEKKRIFQALVPLFDRLTELHSKNKAHGNIQPSTLLVSSDDHISLEFFETNSSSAMVSSSEYAPPEAHQNPPPAPTVQGDVYAIGAVLYRAICGQSPMRASNRAARGQDALLMPPELGKTVAEGLARGLALKPESRPTSVNELQELLLRPNANLATPVTEAAVQPSPPAVTPANIPTPVNPPSSPTTPVPQTPQLVAPSIVKRLPVNLTVGRLATIPVSDLLKDPSSWQIRILNAEELGLSLDDEKKNLVGTPQLSGEHQLHIELTHLKANDRMPLNQSIAVTINPDPDSLWKNLPSDEKDSYFKPDTDHNVTLTPHAWIIAASQRGRSHAHEALFRDDDFRIRCDERSLWHLLAAADGAGSAKFSRRGSQIACEQALAFMEKWLASQKLTLDAAVQTFVEKADDGLMRAAAYSWLGGAAFEARKAIQFEAEQKNPPATIRDYHTTLLLAVATLTQAGWLIATFSIGDGGIALRRGNGEPKTLCTPDSGEYGGQTIFLTASNVLTNADHIMQRIHTTIESDLSALVLMTDGVTDPKFPTEVSLSDTGVWKAFWDELNSAVDFLSKNKDVSLQLLKWLSFRSPGNHDDRTIVLLIPNAKSEQAPT